MIVGGLGALFIHHLQPRLRNDHGKMFEGVDKKKVMRHTFWEGAATIVILFLRSLFCLVPRNNVDDRVSMRLGGGDTSYEILQSLSYGDEITSRITNMDESLNLQFTILWVEESVYAMDQGVIDWSKMKITIPHIQ